MSMPRALPRTHFKPSWKGDRLYAIKLVSQMKAGGDGKKAIDMNFVWGQHKAWCLHWNTPYMNNYYFYLDPGAKRARRMKTKELRRPVQQWTDVQIARWRRSPNPNSAKPASYATCVRYAHSKGVIVVAELKSAAFATEEAASYMVRNAKKSQHPAYFMALLQMKNCRGKAEAIHKAGGEFAVIFGRAKSLTKKPTC